MSTPSTSVASSSASTAAPPVQSTPESFVPSEDDTRCKTPETVPGARPPGWEHICWAPKPKLHKYRSFTGSDNDFPMALMFNGSEDDLHPATSNFHSSSDAQTTPKPKPVRKSLA